MEKNSVWILVLVALTTTVAFMTKVLEYRLALLRLKAESKLAVPTHDEQIVVNTEVRKPRKSLVMATFNLIMLVISFLAIIFTFFFAPKAEATIRDVAFLILMGVTAIMASRPID